MQSKQFREAVKRREWLGKKEEEGFCTLCMRKLYPHKETEACKFTNNHKYYAMQKPRMQKRIFRQ